MMGMGSEIQRTPQMAHADPTWSPFDLHKQRLMKSFIGPRSGHCLVSRLLETWLMWPWHVKIHATSPKVMQPLLALLCRILPNQTSYWSLVQVLKLKCCQDFEMLEQNKSHVVDAGFYRTQVWSLPCLVTHWVTKCSNCWICQSCCWSSISCYMGLSMLPHGFV